LNAIAAVLAPTRQINTPTKIFPSGQPPAATNIAANPNGMAKIVWDILINSPHRWIAENIYTPYHNSTHRLKPAYPDPRRGPLRAHHFGTPIQTSTLSN
jgi:hypothetical protein